MSGGIEITITGVVMGKRTLESNKSGQARTFFVVEFGWLGGKFEAFLRKEEFEQIPGEGSAIKARFAGRTGDKGLGLGKLLKLGAAEPEAPPLSGRRAA